PNVTEVTEISTPMPSPHSDGATPPADDLVGSLT
ncbi:hypothetical protein LCGC14_2709520, partial [marine sediment metagenome]